MYLRYADRILFATAAALFVLVAVVRFLVEIDAIVVWVLGVVAGVYAWVALRYGVNRWTGFWLIGPSGPGLSAVLRATSTSSFDLLGAWIFGALAGAFSIGDDSADILRVFGSSLHPLPWVGATCGTSLLASMAIGVWRRRGR